jgi:hypothetical protein
MQRTVAVAAIVSLFAMVPGWNAVSAQTPEASPMAAVQLPDGPLGEQIQWILDTANAGAGTITEEQINEHFSLDFLAETPLSEVLGALTDLQSAGITYELDPMIITTMDLPASNGNFILIGSDESETRVSVQIDRDSGMITGLTVQPASDATPVASPAA